MHFRLYAYMVAAMITVTANAGEQTNSNKIISHKATPRKGRKGLLNNYSTYCMSTPQFTWFVQYNHRSKTFAGFHQLGKAINILQKYEQEKAVKEYRLLKEFYAMERNPQTEKVIRQAALEPDYESFTAFVEAKTKNSRW